MINFFRKLIRPQYETLNVLEIDAAKLIANYHYLQSLQPGAAIIPVLKSNAYGHGLKEVCQILNRVKPELVAVDSYPEAQIVYKYFRGRVLIIGEMPLAAYDYCKLERSEFVVYNEATLQHLSRYGKRVKIHLFFNSGMNREGIKDMTAFLLKNMEYLQKVEVSGFCSHLASADAESALNQIQENKFMSALDVLRTAGFQPRYIHLGNSAACLTMKSDALTAYRPGLAFYGYSPFAAERLEAEPLQPALDAYSHLVSLQELEVAETVSYNETYTSIQATTIGVIPFGYFEGLDRRLSSRAEFLVRSAAGDFRAQIAGRICMNLTCLVIGNRPVAVGNIVQIISSDKNQPNSVLNLSRLCDTIPYEFLVKLQPNIRRAIINL